MAGVDDPGNDAHRLQRRVRALPVNAGALHDHNIRANGVSPLGQGLAVSLEAAELSAFMSHAAVRQLNDGAARDLCLVHVQANDTFVDGNNVHRYPPVDV